MKWIVKHNNKKFDFEFDEPPAIDEFKARLFSLTELPVNRQKLIIRGKVMATDEDLQGLKKKKTAKFVLYGTDAVAVEAPKEKILFIEDMTKEQRAEHKVTLPCGLDNLGNTCFLNSTVQSLRACTDFTKDVKKWGETAPSPDPNTLDRSSLLSKSFAEDLLGMDKTEDSYEPMAFVSSLRRTITKFAETHPRSGRYIQHDADEFLVELLQTLNNHIKTPDNKKIIDHYFKGQYETTVTCDEKDAGEPSQTKHEDFLKLQAFIDRETVNVKDGVSKKLEEKIEKRSEILGTNVMWTQKRAVSKLPKYLIVQMMRFFWKADISKSAKIRKKVAFPNRIDVKSFCSDKLQGSIDEYRNGKEQILEDRQAAKDAKVAKEAKNEKERAKKEWAAKLGKGKQANPDSKEMDVDRPTEAKETAADAKDEEMKDDAKVEVIEQGFAVRIIPGVGPTFTIRKGDMVKVDEDPEPWTVDKVRAEGVSVDLRRGARTKNALPAKLKPAPEGKLKKPTGWYRIVGLVTHKGQSAGAGHYIGYAREPEKPATAVRDKLPARWLKFDDDRTTVVDDAHVKQLYGGTGDMQMGYLCVYAECEPWEEDAIRD